MARPASLSLAVPKTTSAVSSTLTSPTAARSSSSSPRGARTTNDGSVGLLVAQQLTKEEQSNSPDFTSLPPFPSSPKDTPRHAREPSKGFFSNLKASKSSNKVHHVEPTIRQVSEDSPRDTSKLIENPIYSMRKSPGSTSDLSLSTDMDSNALDYYEEQVASGHQSPRRPVGTSVLSDSMIVTSPSEASHPRRPKPRLVGLLTRTRSMRMDEAGRKSKPPTPVRTNEPEIRMQYDGTSDDEVHQAPPKTAPLRQDHSYRDTIGSSARNRSSDRQIPSNHSQENVPLRRGEKVSTHGLSASASGGFRESGGSHLFTNIKNTSTKAADGLGKAGKSIFGKVARSGSSNAKEEERYVLSVINLPLVLQTRRTRIAQRLADSRDKTEFWMPALPWRCIDFLNFRGCEEEGLYRIPGSELQIRYWQKRFDQEGDINLFEESELYDINIVGSMFKAWLRDLPTEILPKAVQAKVARECADATECPQLLKDELSSLPPWNYYLLFAITCHLSLLIAYSDKNKMNYHNLCVCFQPALKIDNFCFQFLVQDWRNCWQGCWTEKDALEEEYRVLEGGLPSRGSGGGSDGDSSPGSTAVAEERSLASSSSNQAMFEDHSVDSAGSNAVASDVRSVASSSSHKPSIGGRCQQQSRPPPLTFTKPSEEGLSRIYSENSSTPTASGFQTVGDSSLPTNVNDVQSNSTLTRTTLPELVPMLPLSPIYQHFS